MPKYMWYNSPDSTKIGDFGSDAGDGKIWRAGVTAEDNFWESNQLWSTQGNVSLLPIDENL